MNGEIAVGKTETIFDTGASHIVGDPEGITNLFNMISGAEKAPQLGPGFYTSALSSTASWPRVCTHAQHISSLRLHRVNIY